MYREFRSDLKFNMAGVKLKNVQLCTVLVREGISETGCLEKLPLLVCTCCTQTAYELFLISSLTSISLTYFASFKHSLLFNIILRNFINIITYYEIVFITLLIKIKYVCIYCDICNFYRR